jgi:two-component system chemotaxis response regulator CheB
VKTRVVVVDDSDVCRAALRGALEADGDIVVVADASDGAAARDAIAAHTPDLVTMDLAMPGEGGLSVIEWLMAHKPLPVLVVTSQPVGDGAAVMFDAIRRGALEVMTRPAPHDAAAAAALRANVRELARVPVVRHLAPVSRPTSRPSARPGVRSSKPPALRADATRVPIVALGASAGGPSALARVLRDLSPRIHASIGVVQHLPIGFTEGFARFLSDATHKDVSIVSDRTPPAAGTVCVAGDGTHLTVDEHGWFVAVEGDLVCGHRPSVSFFFRSVAKVYGRDAVGVLLTGIGNDGADGLAVMRRAGAVTFAQDEESSIVYGMPRAAIERDPGTRVLGLEKIAAAIDDALRGRAS